MTSKKNKDSHLGQDSGEAARGGVSPREVDGADAGEARGKAAANAGKLGKSPVSRSGHARQARPGFDIQIDLPGVSPEGKRGIYIGPKSEHPAFRGPRDSQGGEMPRSGDKTAVSERVKANRRIVLWSRDVSAGLRELQIIFQSRGIKLARTLDSGGHTLAFTARASARQVTELVEAIKSSESLHLKENKVLARPESHDPIVLLVQLVRSP